MSRKIPIILACLLSLLGCDTDPHDVFVPVTEPEVDLVIRASATEVLVGEPIVLHATRLNRGEWKLVKRNELAREQCWLRRPPPYREEEVSDNLRWTTYPSKNARFNVSLRTDHTREVVFEEPGTYILEPSSKIPCRPGTEVKGRIITIIVSSDVARTTTSR